MPRYPATKNVRSSREETIAEEYVELISQTSVPNASHSRKYTPPPRTMQHRTQAWIEVNEYDVYQDALPQFPATVNRHGNFLLRNTRIVMPTSLQARAVQLAQEGRQGTCKT